MARPRPYDSIGRQARSAPTSAVLLVAYLGLYLSLLGPINGWLWARGEHPTPDHLAHHLMLESAGVTHHHGSSPAAGEADDGALSSASPAITIATPTASANLAPPPILGPTVSALVAPTVVMQLAIGECRPRAAPWRAPPYPPPQPIR